MSTIKKESQKNVIIVIPAYNEGKRIGAVIASIPKSVKVKEQTFTIKVVVIDDCSQDETFIQAKKHGATVLRHIMNSGAGAATRTGLRYAVGLKDGQLAYVGTIDADGQHSAEDVVKMIRFAEENHADMVVGNRLHAGNKKDMPLHRTLGNRWLSFVSKVLFGIKVQDTQSGLRLFKATTLQIVSDYSIDRYGFCTEILWYAVRSGLVLKEMPITVKYSEETLHKGQNNWGVIELLMDLLWIRLNY